MGINERVLALGGESFIKGIKDKGTTVTVHIPIVETEK
jgi:signal transduction histidine kinase